LLNNDAALLPDALAQLRLRTSVDDRERILTLPQMDWLTGELVDRGCLLDPFYNPVPNLDPERTDVAMVIGACLWLPLRLWQELGGFPEWIGSIGEDMYLCCHARLRGHLVESLPASGYRHRQGSSFGGGRVDAGTLDSTFRRRRLSEKNKTLVLAIFTPTIWAWPLLFLHLLALAGEGLILGLVKMDRRIALGIYGHAIASPWRERARIRQLRASVQARRAISARAYFKAFVAYPRKLAMLLRFGIPRIRH
jgi:GT2 family glycosyltransferase